MWVLYYHFTEEATEAICIKHFKQCLEIHVIKVSCYYSCYYDDYATTTITTTITAAVVVMIQGKIQ